MGLFLGSSTSSLQYLLSEEYQVVRVVDKKRSLNFDRNATYGLLPEVEEELRSLDLNFGNPSSVHTIGQRARARIEQAREEVSKLLDLRPSDRVVFTSGASEANNLAISLLMPPPHTRSLALADDSLIIYSAIEHPSLIEPILHSRLGGCVAIYPRNDQNIYVEDYLARITNGTKLVSLMAANNETGQICPLAALSKVMRIRHPLVLLHTDAVQAIGKIEFSMQELALDMVSISGHKIGALAGVGALIISDRVKGLAQILGGPQEGRFRAGTENVLGIVSLGIAARLARRDLAQRANRMTANRDHLLALLAPIIGKSSINLPNHPTLPNTVHLRFPGISADDLVVALDLAGVCVSSGSACASGKPEPSHVLLALGFSETDARESIRISLGADHTEEEIDRAASTIIAVVTQMSESRRAASGLGK